MKPIRKAALVEAAIREVAEVGSLDVTMARVAKSAGMSAPLAHHYFGGKDALFAATMRKILRTYGLGVRHELTSANGPRQRVEAIVRASFSPDNFSPDVISAWLVFYVQSQRNTDYRRLLRVYHQRLRSNLLAGLRPLLGQRAEFAADSVGAMIDGQYLRAALSDDAPSGADAERAVMTYLDQLLREAAQ